MQKVQILVAFVLGLNTHLVEVSTRLDEDVATRREGGAVGVNVRIAAEAWVHAPVVFAPQLGVARVQAAHIHGFVSGVVAVYLAVTEVTVVDAMATQRTLEELGSATVVA